MDKKQLPRIAWFCIFATFCFAAWGFYLGRLTDDQRFIQRVFFAVFSGIASACFAGTAKFESAWANGAKALFTGGFAVWAVFSLFVSSPTSLPRYTVQLQTSEKVNLVGSFTVRYPRPGQTEGKAVGVDGVAYIDDLPADIKVVDAKLVYDGFELDLSKNNDSTKFPIKDDVVKIDVKRHFRPLGEPPKEKLLEAVNKSDFSESDILADTFSADAKKAAKITIVNEAGVAFQLCMYDCIWAFKDPPASPLPKKGRDIRVASTSPPKPVQKFETFTGNSGHFCLYLDYNVDGETKRQALGVHNLLDPANQEIVVSRTPPGHEDFFDVKFTHSKDSGGSP